MSKLNALHNITKLIMFIVIATVIFTTACASMSDVIKEKNNGTAKIYPVTADQAWELSRTVFRWEGTDAIEERRKQGYMLTSSSPGLFSMGTYMGAWIEPINKKNTKVTVVTKRKIATNIATTLTEATYHERFSQGVNLIRSGKPLPIDAP